MKRLRIIGIIALLSLCPVFCQAERQLWVRHNFNTLQEKGKLTFTGSTIGTTDELIYTCSGGGTFAFFTSTYVISLPNNGSEVVISPAISKLAGIYIVHSPMSKCENIKVYVSTDGINWGDPISGSDIVYGDYGTIDVTMNRRNYYVKIVNTKGSAFYISRIDYYTEDCNCFPYIPE